MKARITRVPEWWVPVLYDPDIGPVAWIDRKTNRIYQMTYFLRRYWMNPPILACVQVIR